MSKNNDTEDKIGRSISDPAAHGEAALLLVESLLHGLVRTGALSLSDAIDTVHSAIEVQADLANERGEEPGRSPSAADLLGAIAQSLGIDLSAGRAV